MSLSLTACASLRRLAERIAVGPKDEIALMEGWLRSRGEPVPDGTLGPVKMKMEGIVHEMRMPGMVAHAQLQQLDRSRGLKFDRRFTLVARETTFRSCASHDRGSTDGTKLASGEALTALATRMHTEARFALSW